MREQRCLAARRCECPTMVCKKRVRKGANTRLYIIKSGSGGVRLQVGKPVLMHGLTGAQAPGPDDVGGPTQGSRKKKKKVEKNHAHCSDCLLCTAVTERGGGERGRED